MVRRYRKPESGPRTRGPSDRQGGPARQAGLVRPSDQGSRRRHPQEGPPNQRRSGSRSKRQARTLINADPVLAVPRNARIGQMFTGLVLLNGGFPEQAGEALPRLDALVTPAVPKLRSRIVEVLEADDASLTDAAASLLAGAGRCGRILGAPKDLDLLNALLWIPEAGHQRSDAATRRSEWTVAYTAYANAREPAVKGFMAGSAPRRARVPSTPWT